MQKKDIQIGTAYAIGQGRRDGWARNNAVQGFVLGPDTRRGHERDSVVLRRDHNVTDPVEAQVAYESYSVADFVHITYRSSWPTAAEKEETAAYKEAHPQPHGWYAQSISNANIWQDWSSYVADREQREADENEAAAARAVRRNVNETDAKRIQQSLTFYGLKVDAWKVNASERTVRLTFAQYDELIEQLS